MNKYQSYKPSSVEWIGQIPTSWGLRKIKWICNTNTVQINQEKLNELDLVHYSIPNVQEFGTGQIENGSDIDSSKLIVKGGEILFSKLNPRKGTTCIVDKNDDLLNVCSGEFIVMVPKSDNTKYIHYCVSIKSFIVFIDSLVESVTRSHQRVRPDSFLSLMLPIPPLSEQLQIVQFLDEKTELIDRLISTKERKITLLKEQRTSLINEVVTKGLNPNVKMKDSGVDWIGKIPEGWKVGKLKHNSELNISSVDKHIFEDEVRVKVCNYTDVYYNEFISNNLELRVGSCTTEEYKRFLLEKGDVIITKDSESPNDIGVPSMVVDELENVVCGYHLSIIKSNNEKLIGGYLFRQLQTTRVRRYFEINSNGITRFGLGKSSVLELLLILPPVQEQFEIIKYIDSKTKEIDDLINLEQRKIDLLKEYRQSLISEVVTGKIKVTTDE